MNPRDTPAESHLNEPACPASEIAIAQLVGQVYELAPVVERIRLIEHLLRPLGLFALLAVANGVFAKVWLRNPRQDLQFQPEDALKVSASDVIALVDFVQQVSVEALDGLTQMLAASPVLAGSAALALLVPVLMQRSQSPREEARAHTTAAPTTASDLLVP